MVPVSNFVKSSVYQRLLIICTVFLPFGVTYCRCNEDGSYTSVWQNKHIDSSLNPRWSQVVRLLCICIIRIVLLNLLNCCITYCLMFLVCTGMWNVFARLLIFWACNFLRIISRVFFLINGTPILIVLFLCTLENPLGLSVQWWYWPSIARGSFGLGQKRQTCVYGTGMGSCCILYLLCKWWLLFSEYWYYRRILTEFYLTKFHFSSLRLTPLCACLCPPTVRPWTLSIPLRKPSAGTSTLTLAPCMRRIVTLRKTQPSPM